MSGFDPNEDSLILSEGADYVASFMERGVTWPEGTMAVLSFPDLEDVGPYNGTVNETATMTVNGSSFTGGVAAFVIPAADTTAAKIPKGTRYRLHLTKEHRYLWFRGKVERQD